MKKKKSAGFYGKSTKKMTMNHLGKIAFKNKKKKRGNNLGKKIEKNLAAYPLVFQDFFQFQNNEMIQMKKKKKEKNPYLDLSC